MCADIKFLQDESTVALLDKTLEQTHKKRISKSLHMGQIGDECSRRLWLRFHLGIKETFSGRMLRLFQTGDLIERRIITDLKRAGIKVTGRRRVFSDFNKKFRGRPDGIVEGIKESSKPHVLEIKSMNAKNFKEVLSKGMACMPKYMAQVQCMMGYSNQKRTLVIVENKDTSERYQERVKFDNEEFQRLRAKASAIITAKVPPSGISDRPDYYLCKMCQLNNEEYCRKNYGGVPF